MISNLRLVKRERQDQLKERKEPPLTSVNNLTFIMQVLQGEEQVFQDEAQARGRKPPRRTTTDGPLDTLPQRWVGEDQVLPFRPVDSERV